MRGLGAGIDAHFAVDNVGSETVDIVNCHAVVAPLPGFAAVGAGVNGAEESSGEHRAAGFFEDDRADVLPAQRALCFAPAVGAAFEEHESVLGADPKLPR